ncbi:MAG: hypothetical protein EBS29_08685 [Chloroflexia bacterium]|nr:hypothetical protein [Chloroflexia bacterium]
MFAARPDNVGVQIVLWLSQWCYWPFTWLDAGQPVYGARFERGALLCALICLGITWRINRAPKPSA